MVFNENEESNELIATVANGKNTEIYRCVISGCENPTCTCNELVIHFSPEQGTGETTSPPLYSCAIDLQKQTVGVPETEKDLPETKAFAKRLYSQLNGDDFRYLNQCYFDMKCEATATARPETIKASFDSIAIETEGLMYSYQEILPYAPQLTATINGELHLFSDRYCLSSTCDCTETIFSLFIKEETGNKVEEHCLVQVDYRKKRWAMKEDFTSVVSLDALKEAAEQQIEKLYTLLEMRHLKLKTIYFRNELLSSKPPEPPRLKVGRNEPCPCGSGKKYKKCCLRKQSI